jgi:hypothetical protein
MVAQWMSRWGLLTVGVIVSAAVLAAEAWARAHRVGAHSTGGGISDAIPGEIAGAIADVCDGTDSARVARQPGMDSHR